MTETYLDKFFEEVKNDDNRIEGFGCDDMLAFLKVHGVEIECGKYTDSQRDCEECFNSILKVMKKQYKIPLLSKEDCDLLKEFKSMESIFYYTVKLKSIERVFCGQDKTTIVLSHGLTGNFTTIELNGIHFECLANGEYKIDDLLKRRCCDD